MVTSAGFVHFLILNEADGFGSSYAISLRVASIPENGSEVQGSTNRISAPWRSCIAGEVAAREVCVNSIKITSFGE
jgi:hypothetical protein